MEPCIFRNYIESRMHCCSPRVEAQRTHNFIKKCFCNCCPWRIDPKNATGNEDKLLVPTTYLRPLPLQITHTTLPSQDSLTSKSLRIDASSSSGVGQYIKQILDALDANKKQCFSCHQVTIQLNLWPLEQCKRDRHVIVKRLKEELFKLGLWKKFLLYFKSGPVAVFKGYPINPRSPCESIVDIAIAMAEKDARHDS